MKQLHTSKSVTISFIGAGSPTFTIDIFGDICRSSCLFGSRVIFYDINQSRLAQVAKVCQKYSDQIRANITVETKTSLVDAITDADFVINSALQGGWSANTDIAAEIKKETGIEGPIEAHARFEQLNFLLTVAKEIEKHNPSATLIQCSNPVAEAGTIISRLTKVNFIGVCHGSKKMEQVFGLLGMKPDETESIIAGINHNLRLLDFKHRGEDAYPRLKKWADDVAPKYCKYVLAYLEGQDYQLSPAAFKMYKHFGLFPVGDTVRASQPHMHRWHKNFQLEQQLYGPVGGRDSRPGFIGKMNQRQQNSDGIELAANGKIPVSDLFPEQYSEWQVIPIIVSMVTNVTSTQIVNITNNGAIPQLPDHLIVELPAKINKSGISVEGPYLFPKKIVDEALMPHLSQIERHVTAFCNHDASLLVTQILQNQSVKSISVAKKILNIWLKHDPNMKTYYNL
ncbi:MAG: hypothetical protein WC851_02800 [Candidatus Shapirobacteria bacterium]